MAASEWQVKNMNAARKRLAAQRLERKAQVLWAESARLEAEVLRLRAAEAASGSPEPPLERPRRAS